MCKLAYAAMDDCDTLDQATRSLAKRFGNRPAFQLDDQVVDFEQIDRASDQVAEGLRAEGLSPGDRIAIVAKDCIAGYEILLGCAKAGCVLVPLNWKLSGEELKNILHDSRAKLVFADDTGSTKLAGFEIHPRPLSGYPAWRDSQPQIRASFQANAETPIVQIYTSGTTGIPKGVVLAHRTFFDLRRGMRQMGDDWMGLTAKDRLLLSLPQFHIGGLWWAVQGYLVGAMGVLMESFVGWKALELIEKSQVTQVPMVPAMIQFCLAEPSFDSTDLSSVRGFLYGGSPISSELLRTVQHKFLNAEFFQIYGLTETGNMAVCLRPADHGNDRLAHAAGRPLPGVDCKIVGVNGNELPANQTGEICLRTPSLMLEYWNRPDETNATSIDGWLKTGDAGYVNEEGYLFVSDRIKDMIIYAGENLFPTEIESALLRHEAIRDAAVIGVPDPKWGESPKAFVVLNETVEKPRIRDLMKFAKSQLAEFKVPKSFEFVTDLPRNPSGKILKSEIRRPYWQNQNRKVN
ncbi:Long-chain-fatty-acid--CoA ligase FadD13 [Roseimaritima multifibrata]|uniref:Long-chain-fatty-acid--CoA ligase FadD13 n=1 Tax=Roseimaritima multifibrata TaxID=1930274 RepID=A0A517MHP7_9BACT|nr:long-chain-fatty-acid--CoA ligase [Roseimaritima multifibrata]QDS94401.1 Long-chain-fatty-acid--CoA ligase FadD13 [Roseimaritima multifibrata]